MKQVHQGTKRWLVFLLAGILLFVGGGGTGYALGLQHAQKAQTSQVKKGPSGLQGRPSGKPSGQASQNNSSGN